MDGRTRLSDQEQMPLLLSLKLVRRQQRKAWRDELVKPFERLQEIRKEVEQKVKMNTEKCPAGSRWRRRCCLWRKDWSRWFWLWLHLAAGLRLSNPSKGLWSTWFAQRNKSENKMTKIQRASIFFYCLQELAWSLNWSSFLNKNLASLQAETWS